jgi:glycosyltransferase involved in cell wall biosynthesis
MRLKVLLSAYACEPGKGSEPGVGWSWVHQLARFHDVWVITRANNRAPIERALHANPLPNVHWIFVDLPSWARFWKRGARGVQLYYYLWQLAAYRHGRVYQRRIGFDVVHHVTFGKYWAPSFLALLPVPFVFGPVGGGESAPLAFWRSYGARGIVFDALRSAARLIASLDPFVRLTISRSAIALATTEQTAMKLRRLGARRVLVHTQCGMSQSDIDRLSSSAAISRSGCFRVIGIGRLLHWKGFHLTIRGFAEFQRDYPNSELWIVNDGPERKRLEHLAQSLGIERNVVFTGQLPTLQAVHRTLMESHVLVHPALHEAFGNVCLEAMAAGKPVICLDLGGPAVQVTEETGFKVPANSVDQAVTGIAHALRRLAEDDSLRDRMGKLAVARVAAEFDWDEKGNWLDRLYREITETAFEPAGVAK